MKQTGLILRMKINHLSIQMWCISAEYAELPHVSKTNFTYPDEKQQRAQICMQKELVCQERLSRVQCATQHKRYFQGGVFLQAINCTDIDNLQ